MHGYVLKVTRLGLRSLDGNKVFARMDLPSEPITPGSLGDGYEPRQIIYGNSLEKLGDASSAYSSLWWFLHC